jgi:hypothetical protein
MAGVFGWVAGWMERNFLFAPEIATGELGNMASVMVGSRKWPSRDRSGSVSRLPWATGH